MKYKVGFIGCGNMGGVILNGVISNVEPSHCGVCDSFYDKVKPFIDKGVNNLTLKEVFSDCEYVFLAVKPQSMKEVLEEGSKYLSDKTVLITMAAGLEIQTIKNYAKKDLTIIRIMPNQPCLVNSGVILYTLNSLISTQNKEYFLNMLKGLALLDEIEEDKMDIASVLSGCGPAFMYILMDAFKESAKNFGLDEKKALLYTLKTMEGASKLVENSDKDIKTLIDIVCSPKGTTIEGVRTLEKLGFRSAIYEALKASADKGKSM